MKRFLLTGLMAALAVLSADSARAKEVDLAKLGAISGQFPFAIEVGKPGEKDHRLVYADVRTHIHVYRVKDGKLQLDWETTNLGSRVTSMFVADLYGDGRQKLLVSTAAGRIIIYGLQNYDLVWENLQDPFERVHYMVASNLDEDVQLELVFIADGYLYIYDGLNKNIEWKSQAKFDARQIVIADVDDDEQYEIILNSGTIIDSRFYTIEFQAETTFGDRITLFDLTGDGIPEVFGEFGDFNLKVFDLYAEREIW